MCGERTFARSCFTPEFTYTVNQISFVLIRYPHCGLSRNSHIASCNHPLRTVVSNSLPGAVVPQPLQAALKQNKLIRSSRFPRLMSFIKLFPCALAVCLCALLSAATVTAQTTTRQTSIVTTSVGGPRLETDPIIISTAKVPVESLSSSVASKPGATQLNQLLLAAIDTRLGSPYIYGSSGPYSFDCSGFVWSVFQSAGIRFDRGSARTLWARFAPATAQEETQFGTLVFFNGLTHVGIVADANGFYHSSRSYGVIYSPFNNYWLSRVDGFRRIPASRQQPQQQVAE